MAYVYLLRGLTDGEVKVGRTSRPGLVELDRLATDEPARWEKHLLALLEPWRIPGTREWFRVSSERLAEAAGATRVWAMDDLAKELRVSELAAQRSDGRLLKPDSLALDLCEELRRLKAHEYAVKVRRLRVENELRLLIGTADGVSGVASWKTTSQRRFQQARFKSARADLFERFVEPVLYRPFRLV